MVSIDPEADKIDPAMFIRIEGRTRLRLAGLANSVLAQEPRKGHGHCSSSAVIQSRSRSEKIAMSSQEMLGSRDPRH